MKVPSEYSWRAFNERIQSSRDDFGPNVGVHNPRDGSGDVSVAGVYVTAVLWAHVIAIGFVLSWIH